MKTDRSARRRITRLLLAAGVILLLPLVAMQVTDQMTWDPADFVLAGALLAGTALTYELAARTSQDRAYRAAVGVALAAVIFLVWLNLAVGVIGTEQDRANLMYLGVIAVGVIGALLARFRPQGMAYALFATALAQALVAVIALVFRWGFPGSGPLEIVALNGGFVGLFAGSALLFRVAALHGRAPARRPDGSRA